MLDMTHLTLAVTLIGSFLASSGFWAVVQHRIERKSATTKLLLGLAHDRIVTLGMKYIERGWITKDEYEDFRMYLYDPYATQGGNGLAERVMKDVCSLPFWTTPETSNTPPKKETK